MTVKRSSLYDVRDIGEIIWKRKWLIIVPLILVTLATYGASLLITPEYEASAIISISDDVHLNTELQRLLGIEPVYRRDSRRRDQLRGIYNEVTSSAYLSQLVQQLQLDQDPILERKARQLKAVSRDASLEQIKLDLIQNQLKNKISVSFVADDQVQITVQSERPRLARDIANSLGDIFINERVKQELTSLRSSQDFSDIQLEKYENLLEEKINERTTLEQRLRRMQLDESITSEGNRSEITSEITMTDNEIDDSRQQERTVLGQLGLVEGLSTAQLSLKESDRYEELKSDLRGQLRSMSEQMARYAWSDPEILNFKLRQNNILNSIEAENRTSVNAQYGQYDDDVRGKLIRLFNIRTNLDYLYMKASYLGSAIDELTAKINMIPELQSQLSRLNEEIATTTDIRDRFKRQEASSSISQDLLQDASSVKYKVIEPAKLPLAPFKPDRKKVILMGLVLGLVIGAGAAVVAELLDNSLKKVEEVEDFLNLPVLGITPKAEFLKKVRR